MLAFTTPGTEEQARPPKSVLDLGLASHPVPGRATTHPRFNRSGNQLALFQEGRARHNLDKPALGNRKHSQPEAATETCHVSEYLVAPSVGLDRLPAGVSRHRQASFSLLLRKRTLPVPRDCCMTELGDQRCFLHFPFTTGHVGH